MRRGLFTRLYDGDAGIAGYGPNPGDSARSRYINSYLFLNLVRVKVKACHSRT
jgi:hypothetical protein